MSLNDQLQSKINALMPILINEAVTWTLDNFAKQQWDGTAWTPLSKSTIKKRKLAAAFWLARCAGNQRPVPTDGI